MSAVHTITITWPSEINEHGRPLLWFGSWLVGGDGVEGPWFYNGRGGEVTSVEVPAVATGLRLRRWPNEGFDAEYADFLDLTSLSEVNAGTDADFDNRQEYSRLPFDIA